MTLKYWFLPPKDTSLDQTVSFEPSCVKIGCVVWAVDLRKKQNIYINIHRRKMHIRVIFHQYVEALFLY